MNADIITKDEPLWIRTLREQSHNTSQAKVGEAIRYSASVVNQVLKGTYKGDVQKVELAVRGAFLGETVGCPVLGELPSNICLEHQRATYAATNHQRVQLYRACRNKCPNSQIGADKK